MLNVSHNNSVKAAVSEVRRPFNESNCQDNVRAENIKSNFRCMIIETEDEFPLKDLTYSSVH